MGRRAAGEVPLPRRRRAGLRAARLRCRTATSTKPIPSKLQLVTPEEAERGGQACATRAESSLGTALSTRPGADAEPDRRRRSPRTACASRTSRSTARASASRAATCPQGYGAEDQRRKLSGRSGTQVRGRVSGAGRAACVRHRVRVVRAPGRRADSTASSTVSTRSTSMSPASYFFGVGLADVTICQNKISGSVEPSQVDGRYDDDVISDGRLAFYGKAKLQGQIPDHGAGRHHRARSGAPVRRLHQRRSAGHLPPPGSGSVLPGLRRRLHDLSRRGHHGPLLPARGLGQEPGACGATSTPASPAPSTRNTCARCTAPRSTGARAATNAWGDPGTEAARVRLRGADRAGPQRVHRHRRQPVLPASTPTCCRVRTSWCWKYAT